MAVLEVSWDGKTLYLLDGRKLRHPTFANRRRRDYLSGGQRAEILPLRRRLLFNRLVRVKQRRILSPRGLVHERKLHAEPHIDSIVRQEEEALERRPGSERLADAVGSFAGSLLFVVLHLVLLIAWLQINSGRIASARPFDPYPFSLLGVIVAVEAVILSSFILMRQPHDAPRGASGPPEFAS
jgi:hypothetical protein